MQTLQYGLVILTKEKPVTQDFFGGFAMVASSTPSETVKMVVSKYQESDMDPNQYKVKLVPYEQEDKKRFPNHNMYASDLLHAIEIGNYKIDYYLSAKNIK